VNVDSITSNLPAIALVLAGLCLVVMLVMQAMQISQLRQRLDMLTRGADGASLEGVLDAHLELVHQVSEDLDDVTARTAALETGAKHHLSRVGLVRFNPFPDTGGNQSFALAMLDDDENGFIVSSLHSRTGTRIYAKSVAAGKTETTLSSEEAEAIDQARAGAPPAVAAPAPRAAKPAPAPAPAPVAAAVEPPAPARRSARAEAPARFEPSPRFEAPEPVAPAPVPGPLAPEPELEVEVPAAYDAPVPPTRGQRPERPSRDGGFFGRLRRGAPQPQVEDIEEDGGLFPGSEEPLPAAPARPWFDASIAAPAAAAPSGDTAVRKSVVKGQSKGESTGVVEDPVTDGERTGKRSARAGDAGRS
jgi:hypothetical protein